MKDVNEDIVIATVNLVDRCGASGFDLGYLHEDVPVAEAGWWAVAHYQGTRIMVDDHRSPSGAALALAERLLTGAACRCGEYVSLSDTQRGCRWRLIGQTWTPGCDAPPVQVDATRGDYAAIQEAMHSTMNRAERRKADRKKKK